MNLAVASLTGADPVGRGCRQQHPAQRAPTASGGPASMLAGWGVSTSRLRSCAPHTRPAVCRETWLCQALHMGRARWIPGEADLAASVARQHEKQWTNQGTHGKEEPLAVRNRQGLNPFSRAPGHLPHAISAQLCARGWCGETVTDRLQSANLST